MGTAMDIRARSFHDDESGPAIATRARLWHRPERREADNSGRGALRTLGVLRALNERNGATVTELSETTGISRPALYRILSALCDSGYVVHRESDGGYILTRLVASLSKGFRSDSWTVEVATPVMEELQKKIMWPTDLSVFRDDRMRLLHTTRPLSPYAIDFAKIGAEVSMTRSALGLAYLAFAEPAQQKEIIETVQRTADNGFKCLETQGQLMKRLNDVRARGYAWRYRIADSHPLAAKTGSIAIPVRMDGAIVATAGITFIATALTVDEAARRYLAQLQAAARDIESLITT